jgi:hypothetical protein
MWLKKIICPDSLSNLIVTAKKNPKAAELKDLMAEEGITTLS